MSQKISQHEFPKVREKESVFNKSLLHFFDFSHHQHWKFEKQKHDRLLFLPPLFYKKDLSHWIPNPFPRRRNSAELQPRHCRVRISEKPLFFSQQHFCGKKGCVYLVFSLNPSCRETRLSECFCSGERKKASLFVVVNFFSASPAAILTDSPIFFLDSLTAFSHKRGRKGK